MDTECINLFKTCPHHDIDELELNNNHSLIIQFNLGLSQRNVFVPRSHIICRFVFINKLLVIKSWSSIFANSKKKEDNIKQTGK